jgi:hypothetical protein
LQRVVRGLTRMETMEELAPIQRLRSSLRALSRISKGSSRQAYVWERRCASVRGRFRLGPFSFFPALCGRSSGAHPLPDLWPLLGPFTAAGLFSLGPPWGLIGARFGALCAVKQRHRTEFSFSYPPASREDRDLPWPFFSGAFVALSWPEFGAVSGLYRCHHILVFRSGRQVS